MRASEDRDRLVEILWGKMFPYGGAGCYIRPDANASHAIANAILAEGFRRPRTVETIDQLNALPDGAVIRNHSVYEHFFGQFHGADAGTVDASLISLPVTVLYEPESTP